MTPGRGMSHRCFRLTDKTHKQLGWRPMNNMLEYRGYLGDVGNPRGFPGIVVRVDR